MGNEYELDKVGRWMTTRPVTVDESATVIEAMHLMKERRVRRLPVMRGGKIAGLVTEQMMKEYTPSKATRGSCTTCCRRPRCASS
jgi:acetoin utilization protein AcuB